MNILKAGVIAMTMATATLANAGELIVKQSAHSVDVTLDRLTAAIEGAGAKVFARVDHAKGAASVDQDLRPTQMLMELLSNLVFEESRSCGDLALFSDFNSIIELDASNDFSEVVKAS